MYHISSFGLILGVLFILLLFRFLLLLILHNAIPSKTAVLLCCIQIRIRNDYRSVCCGLYKIAGAHICTPSNRNLFYRICAAKY